MSTDRLVVTHGDDDEDWNSDDEDGDAGAMRKQDDDVIDFNDIEKKANKERRLKRKADSGRVPTKRRVKQSAKIDHDRMSMVRPNTVDDRERERRLNRIATLGVVKLFNVVAERRKAITDRLGKNGEIDDLKRNKEMAAGFAPNDFDRRLSGYKQHKYKRETKVEIDDEDQKPPTIGRKMKEYGRKKRTNSNSSDVKEEVLSD